MWRKQTYNHNGVVDQTKTEEIVSVAKHRFTVEEYHRMGEAGIFGEDDRMELIHGEVVKMAPIGWRHAECVRRLINLLARFVAEQALASRRLEVDAQNPVALSRHQEPQPDLTLVEGKLSGRLPGPAEVPLVVEVSDTTIAYDRNIKLPLYASAGIPEAWIGDLNEGGVEVHSDPGPQGYGAVSRFGRGERVVSATVPGLTFATDEILPAR